MPGSTPPSSSPAAADGAERERLAGHVGAVREDRGDDAAWFALARVLFNLGEFTHRP